MDKHLYVVILNRGRNNPDFASFHENVTNLNAKSPDFGGINNVCLLSHHMNADIVHSICSDGFKDESQLTVEEITTHSLNDNSGDHKIYSDIVQNYFLRYNKYKNLK